MKKSIGIFLIIISLAACNRGGETYSDAKKSDKIQNNSIEVEEISTDNIDKIYHEDKFSETEGACSFMERARLQNDPVLEELYRQLGKLQDSSDETSKYPKSQHLLKEITKNIGEIKGLILYRSLKLTL